MVVVRSPVAHAKLGALDVDDARAMAGVIGVFTAADLRSALGRVPVIPPRVSFESSVVPYLQPILAEGVVRYVGEPMAIVLAENRYVAEDAAEAVFAELEPLDAVIDARGASASPSPMFPEGNLVTTLEAGYGDPVAAFAEAEVIVEMELSVGRHSGVPMETRGIGVEPDPATGRLRVHGATKVPHWNLAAVADLLSLDPRDLVFVENAVGGAFGVRGELYPEDVLAVWAALRLSQPITWIEDRREHLVATNHSREQHHLAAIASTRDGRIVALRSEFWVDLGAYIRTHGVRVPDLTLSMLPGPYDIPAYRGRAHCVMTNKTPTGTYRSPGRFESSFVRERLIDGLADRLEMEPAEIRRRNLIAANRMPHSRPLHSTGEPMTFGEGDYPAMLERVLEAAPIAEMVRRRSSGEMVGWGVAMFLEKSGLGPWESSAVEVDTDGIIHVRSGATSVGQGIRTVLTQIVADRLRIPPHAVMVDLLDTDSVPEGIGSWASRSTVTAGSAALLASDLLVEKARQVIADSIEISVADITYGSEGFGVIGSPDHEWFWKDVARLVQEDNARSGSSPERLGARTRFDVERVVYPYGAVWAGVSIDPGTGVIDVEELVITYDIGRAVNPVMAWGQIHGGAAQALGGALFEEFVFDPEGNPLATTFADYLLPTAAEVPKITAILVEDHPTSTNPLGVKGAGEAGVPGVAAAIAAAVEHAGGGGAWIRKLPIQPGDVRAELRSRAAGGR